MCWWGAPNQGGAHELTPGIRNSLRTTGRTQVNWILFLPSVRNPPGLNTYILQLRGRVGGENESDRGKFEPTHSYTVSSLQNKIPVSLIRCYVYFPSPTFNGMSYILWYYPVLRNSPIFSRLSYISRRYRGNRQLTLAATEKLQRSDNYSYQKHRVYDLVAMVVSRIYNWLCLLCRWILY